MKSPDFCRNKKWMDTFFIGQDSILPDGSSQSTDPRLPNKSDGLIVQEMQCSLQTSSVLFFPLTLYMLNAQVLSGEVGDLSFHNFRVRKQFLIPPQLLHNCVCFSVPEYFCWQPVASMRVALNQGREWHLAGGAQLMDFWWTAALPKTVNTVSEGMIPHLYYFPRGYHQMPQPADFICFPTNCYRYDSCMAKP